MELNNCSNASRSSKIKVEEKGKKATFLNGQREEMIRTKIDGCLIKNSIACDWAVSKKGVGDVVIELKGVDVSHATEQILTTAKWWQTGGRSNGAIAGLIVCTQFPRFSTKIQKAKDRLRKELRAPLHVVPHNREYVLESLLNLQCR